jgi:hypothetical protein
MGCFDLMCIGATGSVLSLSKASMTGEFGSIEGNEISLTQTPSKPLLGETYDYPDERPVPQEDIDS